MLMKIVNYLIQDGPFWVIVGALIAFYKSIDPLITSHLRNNHEKSLHASADRAIPIVAKLVDASPTDRMNYGIQLIIEFATNRHIPINHKLAKSFYGKALSDFLANGGKFAQPKQTVSVMPDGSIKEDDNK